MKPKRSARLRTPRPRQSVRLRTTDGEGSDYLVVFRVVGTSSFMAYGLANLVDSVWKAQPWGTTVRHTVDGLVYSLLTAGVFGWLWP